MIVRSCCVQSSCYDVDNPSKPLDTDLSVNEIRSRAGKCIKLNGFFGQSLDALDPISCTSRTESTDNVLKILRHMQFPDEWGEPAAADNQADPTDAMGLLLADSYYRDTYESRRGVKCVSAHCVRKGLEAALKNDSYFTLSSLVCDAD